MEASFESVCDSVSWKAGRKLAYGLVKKNHFSQGPQALLLDCFLVFYKCRLHTYSDRPVLWNSSRKEVKKTTELPARSNFLFGLLITLGDPKAIFFYISFLPVFVDLSRISITDLTIIITLIIIAVGGTKLTYACLADKARIFFKSPQSKKWMNTIAGCVLIVSGVFLILKD